VNERAAAGYRTEMNRVAQRTQNKRDALYLAAMRDLDTWLVKRGQKLKADLAFEKSQRNATLRKLNAALAKHQQ
jgi:hypothetical protein